MKVFTGKIRNNKVFVGMSGGVDSSVSAAILKKAGHEVTGVFIKVWQPDWLECDSKEERLDAMRAAAHIGIPFLTLDLQKEYKAGVIDYMLSEYRAGRTPNPDVMCNRKVKFGAFWKWAKGQGADLIATGHYAQNENGRLLISKDKNKDQTYFLWTLTKDDLKHILFPIGGMTKPEVRKLAKDLKLPNADKKDSQGLCFIGKVDLKEFLKHYIKAEPGDVLSENGEVIGKHPSALLFTIGERRGFTITKKTPADAPYFVFKKDMTRNTITVSNKDTDDSLSGARKVVRISGVNWISGAPELGKRIQGRSRYRETLQDAEISSIIGNRATIGFSEPQSTLSPGQSLVAYDGGECLGGGIIV